MKKSLTLLIALLGSIGASAAEPAPANPAREIAITIDDLPAVDGDLAAARYVTTHLLRRLRDAKIPAVGFVNESKLFTRGQIDIRAAMLTAWLDGGHELGNHTYSHVNIASVPFETYREDLIRGETVTRMLLAERGQKLTWFRHTQLRTGPTAEYKQNLDALLAERGYRIAPVTIDNNDYIFARAYANARQRKDAATMRRLVDEYLRYMEQVVAHFEGLSRDFLGREVKQVLLLHANELNADHLGALAARLRARGYSFITLDAALTDPAYQLPEAQSARGISWLHRWMLAKGLEMREEPLEPEWVRTLAK
jgi:peptidoglycan/xylan/chitin deacetylase (PgdA/CDA1 family)